MARFIPSAFLSSIKGKIGSTVFQANAAGHFIRTLGKTHNGSTEKQIAMHVYMATLHRIWITLSLAQQQSWYAFAQYANITMKHNTSKIISGYSCFIKINIPRIIYNHVVLSNPLPSNIVPAAANCYATIIAPHFYIQSSRVFVPTNEFLICSITPPLAAGKTYNNKNYSQLIITTPAANIQKITTEYENLYGVIPQSGQIIGLYYSIVSLISGLQTPFQYIQAIV